MAISRREVLMQVGRTAGLGATYGAMQLLGLAAATPIAAADFTLPNGSGNGRSVVVLGAGIAGLVSAYELERAGYQVTLLEARDRIGGRSWTIRGGDAVIQHDRPDQRAAFSSGLYFNAGPARIPCHHHAILGYAKRLGVPLEVFVNENMNTSWDFNGRIMSSRRMRNDFQSRIGELLAKAIDAHALDAAMPKDDLKQFRQFLIFYAGLDDKGVMKPNQHSGYKSPRGGYDTPGELFPPLTMRETVPSGAAVLPQIFHQILDMQPTMLQPVGGMDRIAHALHGALRSKARLNEPVTAVRREGDGVRIEHRSGVTRADYCVCALPGNLLGRIPNDFSPAKQQALKDVPMLKSVKVAFEAPRFWESDQHIYGGMAWTDRLNENVLYPSSGFHSQRGVLVGAYCAGWTHRDTPDRFAALPIAEQIAISRGSVEALHPGRSKLLEKPIAIDWGQVPYSEGVGAVGPDFDDAPAATRRGPRYLELTKPEGPIVFAGEHLAYVGLWQESAALSAHAAVSTLARMAAERKTVAA